MVSRFLTFNNAIVALFVGASGHNLATRIYAAHTLAALQDHRLARNELKNRVAEGE
jgi:hypothetical protein